MPWTTIGIAIDYRIRYNFAITPPIDLVAVHGGMWVVGAGGPLVNLDNGTMPSAPAHQDFILYRPDDLGELSREEARSAAALGWPLVEHFDHPDRQARPVGRRLAQDDEAELCRVCYALALYEELFRAGLEIGSPLYGLPVGATLVDLLGLARPAIVNDLCRLSWAFYDGQTELIGRTGGARPGLHGIRRRRRRGCGPHRRRVPRGHQGDGEPGPPQAA